MLILGIYTCIIGILNVWTGAAKDSRFYVYDNIVVRLLGIAFIVLGVALLLKQHWVLPYLAVVFLLSIVEVAVTKPTLPLLVFYFFFFGLPFLYLAYAIFGSAK